VGAEKEAKWRVSVVSTKHFSSIKTGFMITNANPDSSLDLLNFKRVQDNNLVVIL
jgi:hypothetical protein